VYLLHGFMNADTCARKTDPPLVDHDVLQFLDG
jgi:hypothetical protein